MHALATSSLIFSLIFVSALVGMFIRRVVPESHFTPEAKDTVRLAIGLVVTMTGLVLGMLVSSSKNFYDSEKNQVAEMASQVILLNDQLIVYGPEATAARIQARKFVEDAVDRIWPNERSQTYQLRPENYDQEFYRELELLEAKNATQVSVKAQMMTSTVSLKRTYWLMYLQSVQTSVPLPLLGVVTSWLMAIFVSFGIFAPRNATVMLTLIVCALAVSAALFIIMSMCSPFSGILRISPIAVREALGQMGQ
jgi:hypothetical protein